MKPPFFFVFDVESIGLHGEGFAVGFVIASPDGKTHEEGILASPPEKAGGSDEDRLWVFQNVPKNKINCDSANTMRVKFWEKWMEWKAKGAVMVSDCGWPVEARFLIACIEWDEDARKWDGPYPLHDLASVMLARGVDPLVRHARLHAELPPHDPLCDARQSARLLLGAL